MPTLKSTTTHNFGGKKLKRGDIFEATDREAKLVIALGRAKPYQTRALKARKTASAAPAPEPAAETQIETGDQSNESAGLTGTEGSVGADGSDAAQDNPGAYDRRDMKADLE